MAGTGISEYLYQTQQEWANRGAPKETFAAAGTFWKLLVKRAVEDWEGDGDALLAVRSQRQGNFGANYSRLLTAHTSSSGEKYTVPAGKLFGIVSFTTKFLEFTRTGKNLVAAMSGKADEIDQTLGAYQNLASMLMWQDGTGKMGKGDGAYSVAGAVITFKNARSAACFEKGDVLVLISEAAMAAAAPGTLPTPRAGTVTVSKVNETAGTVTLTGNVTAGIAAAVNTDWISKYVFFDDAEDGIPNGVFTWLARNNTLATSTVYGVDRSIYPDRLAGRRVSIGTTSSTASPWSICAQIMQENEISGSDIDTIWVPAHEVSALMEEMSARNITQVPVSIGMNAAVNLQMAVNGIGVSYGSTRAVLLSDRYLIDHSKTQQDDRQYVGLNMQDWMLKMGPTGWGFKDYEGDGSILQRDPLTEKLYAEIGAWMALFTDNTGRQIYAGVDVTA